MKSNSQIARHAHRHVAGCEICDERAAARKAAQLRVIDAAVTAVLWLLIYCALLFVMWLVFGHI